MRKFGSGWWGGGVLALLFLWATTAYFWPVADGTFVLRFARQRKDLDELVAVLASNRTITFVDARTSGGLQVTDYYRRSFGVSELGSAGAELRRLFDRLGCIYVSRDVFEIRVAPNGHGLEDLYPGGYKVFAFCSTQPTNLVNSIDDFRRQNRGTYGCYRHLEGQWYIKYEEAF